MIFIVNVLIMNGGSTFVLRVCRELVRRGIRPTVLILIEKIDEEMLSKLTEVANVFILRDFLVDRGMFFRGWFGLFGCVEWGRLIKNLFSNGQHVHVMGVFGLMFARRVAVRFPKIRLSVGIYHQNEFLFRRTFSFLTEDAQSSFGNLNPSSIIFFNDISRSNYSKFFKKDYAASPTVPIGIETMLLKQRPGPSRKSKNIVSVGNLVSFKTYNRHMISVLAELRPLFPDLRYEIYGDGPERSLLQAHANCMGVADRVDFNGMISYSEFSSVVQGALVFVGSGTALVEAAALGVPALIGIDSIVEPESFGFLNQISGFSYNEGNIVASKVSLRTCIENLLLDPGYRLQVGCECRRKAHEFGVQHTVDGFLAVAADELAPDARIGFAKNIVLFFSLLNLGLYEMITGRKLFSDRRAQSYF